MATSKLSSIIFLHPWWLDHMAWNLKWGLGGKEPLFRVRKRRWWLDLALGRTQKMAFSQSSNSIVDYKWLDLDEDHSLRAFPTITPGEINTTIRERLLECVKSKKSSQGALRGVRPPCFSLAPQTALKSPIKT